MLCVLGDPEEDGESGIPSLKLESARRQKLEQLLMRRRAWMLLLSSLPPLHSAWVLSQSILKMSCDEICAKRQARTLVDTLLFPFLLVYH